MGDAATSTPTWIQLGYLVAAVCFILALKALSSPRTARIGNLVGAAGAVLAVVLVFVAEPPRYLAWILGAIALGGIAGARDRPAGRDDGDAAARRGRSTASVAVRPPWSPCSRSVS